MSVRNRSGLQTAIEVWHISVGVAASVYRLGADAQYLAVASYPARL